MTLTTPPDPAYSWQMGTTREERHRHVTQLLAKQRPQDEGRGWGTPYRVGQVIYGSGHLTHPGWGTGVTGWWRYLGDDRWEPTVEPGTDRTDPPVTLQDAAPKPATRWFTPGTGRPSTPGRTSVQDAQPQDATPEEWRRQQRQRFWQDAR